MHYLLVNSSSFGFVQYSLTSLILSAPALTRLRIARLMLFRY
jgi:hypothetical protein